MNNARISIGDAAPDFSLMTATGDEWRLSEQLGNVVAMLFYPKDETLVCTRQLCSVRDHWQEYLDTKAVVVGVSVGTQEEHGRFTRRHNLPMTLLADTDGAVTDRYCRHWILPKSLMRSIVVVDARGIVRTRRTMFRSFRPSDRYVMMSIYAARSAAMNEEFAKLAERRKYSDEP